ncbi:uncharacterized protein LOC117924897 [Vitis riparia]|uniref:uncharacterized protein LOC117924897 n=1 Tax=Vitis riparia TaxID=96939 RepID=UPI00155A3911|nr:uncharacterized protein LOC117924897 [Vitis riparia]
MAATVSLSSTFDTLPHHHHHHIAHFKPRHAPYFNTLPPKPKHPLPLQHKSGCYRLVLPLFSSSDSPSSTSSFFQDPLRTGRFLSNEELEKLRILENFRYSHEFEFGSMWVRVMRAEEIDITANLLAESFAVSLLLPIAYVKLLAYLVKQYLIEKRALMPHTATLVGFYKGVDGGEEEEQLAGTVEVSFNKRGANASPPTPTPPKNSPYICNMTVREPLRRRGIGWNLLKASEELISQMSLMRDIYLHCRMIDVAPFNMYTKAGYKIVKTDSILILLALQRRKHLMCKKLPVLDNPSETYLSGPDEALHE